MPVIYGAGAEPAGMGFATVQAWQAIKQHKLAFFGWSVGVLVLGLAVVSVLPVKYRATALVEISTQGVDPLAPEGQPEADQFQDDDLPSTVAAMMQSRDVAQAVLAQIPPVPAPPSWAVRAFCASALRKLCERPPLDPQIRQQAAIDDFLKNLEVTPETHSRILDVDVTAGSAERAQALANALVQNYQALSVTQQAAQSDHVAGWLQTRTAELQQRWLNAVQAADRFKSSNNIPDAAAGGAMPLIDQQLADAAASLEAAQTQLIDAETAHRAGSGGQGPGQMSYANTQMLLQLETARSQLAGEFGPNYPKLQTLDQQIAAIRSQPLIFSAGSGAANPMASVATAQARVDRLTDRLDALGRQDAALGALQAQYQILKAEADNAHAAYSTFVEHAAEVADRATLAQPAVTMVSEAGLPLRPSFPDRPKLALGILLLSLAAGGSAALAKHNLAGVPAGSPPARDEIPLLAALPYVPVRPGQQLARHLLDEPYSAAAQAMRGIAQSLALLTQKRGGGRVMLVTSAAAGEGRSIFAAWLASMISQNGGRALLINCGQQIPMPDGAAAAPMQRGFTDILYGNASAGEVIRRDPAMEIDMISAGSISGKVLERDDVTRLQAILSQLKKDYNLVVLDSAPLTAAPDGYYLGEVADESIFICRWQHSAPLAVTAAIDRLRSQGAHVAGIVVSMKHADFTIAADGKTRGREQALITQLYGA